MRNKRIIIGHFGKQHSYRLAEAVKKMGWLNKYLTTIYLKKCNWTKLAEVFLKGDNLNRVQSRRCSVLKDSEVKQFCEFGGLINLLLLRIDKSRKVYTRWSRFLAKRFEKKMAYYAIKNNPDAIVMYDTNASICFDILSKEAPHIKRILDVSSATHRYMKRIYEEDMERTPKFAKSLKKSCDYFWEDKYLKRYSREVQLSQFFLVPSKFVKKSLEFEGISPDKIFICPYGVDTTKFLIRHVDKEQDKLRCVYVGALTQRKGISYLLEAFEKYNNEKVSLTLVGKYDNSDGLFNEYLEKYNFTGHITHDKVAEILAKSDVMIFPSLSDAYGLSVLEALGSGLPVICTENTGASDVIKDKYNGFVIPAGNIEQIRVKVDWFLSNAEELNKMKINARNTAMHFPWDAYNKRIEGIMKKIMED